MMIKKIISGGQTGADRAALDTAIKFNIDHGGWIPKGRRAEDGVLPARYRLKEMPTDSYPRRTEENIRDSHATLIIARGELTGGSLLTRRLAGKLGKPCCYIDLLTMDEFEAAIILHAFVQEYTVHILNVAGPRASNDPYIYQAVKGILETLIYMLLMETSPDDLKSENFILDSPRPDNLPQTLNQALALLTKELSLRTRCRIANMDDSAIASLYFSMGDFLRAKLGLDAGNRNLIQDCAGQGDASEALPEIEDAVMIILKALKSRLEKDYILRIMK